MDPGRFWGTFYVTLCSPLQRDKWDCEERCISNVMWTFRSELENVPCVDIFRVGEQPGSKAFHTGL